MTRAVIYCRCSTEEECQKDALIRQAAEARECVCRLNWSLEDEYIESRSGTSTRGREQYQRLFSDLLRIPGPSFPKHKGLFCFGVSVFVLWQTTVSLSGKPFLQCR